MDQTAKLENLPKRIHEVFLPWGGSHAAHVALTDAINTITYGELAGIVDATADRLRGAGVRAGDRVLLIAENSVALAVCILAISQLDAWSASVNARLSDREIDNFLSHSGARLAIYFSVESPQARQHGLARGAQAQTWPGIGEILVGPMNAQALPEPLEKDPALQVAAMVYTSGTTGAPKAVMLTHSNLIFVGNNNRMMRRLVPDDVIYGVLPLSHVYGLSALLVASLMSGSALHLVPRFQAKDLARALVDDGITVLHGAPAMYAKLLELGAADGTELKAPHLRVAQSGGAPLTSPVKEGFERTFGVVLQNGYGMTEASPSICQTRLDAPRSDCSVGLAIPGIEVRLYGADEDPAGIGEIQVRGPNVMKGYYRAPELTAEVITQDGWLKTGDLARIEPDGAFFIVGRSKELIIRSGFNVYPIEVEQVINTYPNVVQSAVVGRDVPGNEEVVAFIEPSQDVTIDLDDLNAYLKSRLSPYKIPSEIISLKHLPAAATGKILKKELQKLAAERSSTARAIP